jgi:hypothetical protein
VVDPERKSEPRLREGAGPCRRWSCVDSDPIQSLGAALPFGPNVRVGEATGYPRREAARRAQVLECRAERFAGVFILIMPKRTSVGSQLPRSGGIAWSGEQDGSYHDGDRKWPLLDPLPTKLARLNDGSQNLKPSHSHSARPVQNATRLA